MAGIIDLTLSGIDDMPEGVSRIGLSERRTTRAKSGAKEGALVRKWRERLLYFDQWERDTYGDIDDEDVEYSNTFSNALSDLLGDEEVNVNWVYLFWTIMRASLSKTNPKPDVEPQDSRYEQWTGLAEAGLAYTMRETQMKRQVDKALDDALRTGRGGFLCTKYGAKFGYRPEEVSEDGHQISDAGREVEHEAFVKHDFAVVRRVRGNQVKFDWNAGEISEASWIAFVIERSVEDFRSDPRYRKEVVDSIVLGVEGTAEEDTRLIKVCEVWDKATNTLLVFSMDGHEQFLIEPRPWPYQLDGGFPLVHLKLIPVADKVYPMNPIKVFYSLMQGNNRVLTNYLRKSGRTVPALMAKKGVLGEDARTTYENALMLGIMETEGHPGEVLAMPLQNMPSDERFLLEQFWGIFNLLAAIDETRAGVQTDKDATATEKLLENQGSQNRNSLWMGFFDDFWSDTLRNVLFLNQQFWDADRYIPIYDTKGEEIVEWTRWSDEMRDAEFAFVGVRAGSTAPPTKQARQAAASKLVTDLAQAIPALLNIQVTAGQSQITFDTSAALRDVLKDHDELDVAAWFPDLGLKQDPQSENMALLFGDAPEVLPTDQDLVHLPSHIRFRQELAMGGWDAKLMGMYGFAALPEVKQSVYDRMQEHIAAHQGKMQMMTPGTPEFQGMQMQGGTQGNEQMPGMSMPGMSMGEGMMGQGMSPRGGIDAAAGANRNGGQSIQNVSSFMGRMGAAGAQNLINGFQG